jgi:S-DNA-T family DNA segregation ATPase FtsK/SpoIIIE
MLLAAVVFTALALASWSVTDPSLSHATGHAARNWMGFPGAILSDLLLQTLGFAALAALLPPFLWAIELVSSDHLADRGAKLKSYPITVALLAGACSSLPTSASWPLEHIGTGGVLGDLTVLVAANVAGLIVPGLASLAAGLALATGGLLALASSARIVASGAFDDRAAYAEGEEPDAPDAGGGSPVGRLVRRLSERVLGFGRVRPGGEASAIPANAERRAEPALGPIPEHHPAAPRPMAPVPMLHPTHSGAMMHTMPVTHAMPRMPVMPYGTAMLQQPHPACVPMGPAHPAPWGEAPPATPFHADDGYPEIHDEPTAPPLPGMPTSRAIAQRFAPRLPAGTSPSEAEPQPPFTPAPGAARGPSPQAEGPGPSGPRRAHAPAEPRYKQPAVALLKRPLAGKPAPELTQTALRGAARLLEDVLSDFGVKGEIKDIKPGPVVTLFELEPARGTKSSRVIALADDIARSMSATSARVAVVPGRNAIGIELPNVRREGVLLREILESESYKASSATLPIALGKSIGGEPVVADLARMPHLLVAGTTGSGKSVGVNAMILSLLYRLTPDECRFIMVDPKMLELSVYNGIPHLLAPVVTDPSKAINALNWVVAEMEERYKRMSKLAVRNIEVFNARVNAAKAKGETITRSVQTGFDRHTGAAVYEQEELLLEPMPYIVVVVDEFADLMSVAGKEIEAAVQRLAQMARAAGIHLIMATQRPSVDIITGTIKANFPTRVSFKVTSKIDSRTILNEQGAEQLLGQGDMLYSAGSGVVSRVHGAFVSDEEVEAIAAALRRQGAPRYVDEILDGPDGEPGGGDDGRGPVSGDDLYDKAVAVVMRDQKASTSYLQRRLGVGYNKAASLIERMEDEGLISPANALGKREILGSGRRLPLDPEDD